MLLAPSAAEDHLTTFSVDAALDRFWPETESECLSHLQGLRARSTPKNGRAT